METVRILNGATERIRVTALDAAGTTITGLGDVLVEIRRKSDGFYYDFNDTTFKASGWTTRQQAMTELDVTNSAGVYYYDFNTTGLSDDEYFIRASSATAVNDPMEGELKVGGYVDDIGDIKTQTDLLPADPASETNVDQVPGETSDLVTVQHGSGSYVDTVAPTSASVADAVLEELIADHSGVSGSLAEFINLIKTVTDVIPDAGAMTSIIDLIKQNRQHNIYQEFIIATVEDSVRKVGVGKWDSIIIKVKNESDADWSSPVTTKTLYCWYDTLGDTNPTALKEDG